MTKAPPMHKKGGKPLDYLINVYWVLNGYPIRPNYDPNIISTNQPTLKYPKASKITKIPFKPKK